MKGDTLILENPSFDSKTFNESGECFYGSNTILYLLPMEQEKVKLLFFKCDRVNNFDVFNLASFFFISILFVSFQNDY
jgi:hypothetical protein